jgi:putative transposase
MSSNRRAFKYRVYPTRAQAETLDRHLAICCELYNAALQERRDAYRGCGVSIRFATQSRQLPAMKQDCPDVAEVYAQVLQDALHRVDKAFAAFFRRVKSGAAPGYPRFRSRRRYDSLTYPQDGFTVEGARLHVSRIGSLRIKLHRPIEGRIKTLSLKREAGRWFAVFSCEVEPVPLPASAEAVGIDVGLTTFATLSDGTEIPNPRFFREGQRRLRLAQRRVARRKRGSTGRRNAVRLLQRAHAHIRNQRQDFAHKAARQIADRFGLIAVEDLPIKGLAGSMLAKSVHDAAWGMFLAHLSDKAEEAGRTFVRVDPRNTTQACSGCGSIVRKTLAERQHRCPACGLSIGRDLNAAKNMLRLGCSRGAPTWGSGPSVAPEAVCFR